MFVLILFLLFFLPTFTKAMGKPSFIGESLFRKCFWSPHFYFVNLHSSEDLSMSSSPNIYMVDKNSNIMVLSYSVVTVGCKFKYHLYPFDYQVLAILVLCKLP